MLSFIPKYESLVPAMRAVARIERDVAHADLLKLVRLANRHINICRDVAKANAFPIVELMKRLAEKKDG
jgi:hypothetical protein